MNGVATTDGETSSALKAVAQQRAKFTMMMFKHGEGMKPISHNQHPCGQVFAETKLSTSLAGERAHAAEFLCTHRAK